jgi:hypothetical protein
MKFSSDIDIDFADRQQALAHIWHVPAVQMRESGSVPHNTGIYVTDIPRDPVTGTATIDYRTAEQRGYIKLDFLNVGLYSQVKSEQHLEQLMSHPPDWNRFNTDRQFFEQLIHVNNHWDLLKSMPEPVDSIPRLAMFLSVIRPAKRYLAGRVWKEVAESVWIKPDDDSYFFKRAHAVAYAHLVVVNMNLAQLADQGD